MRRLVTAVALTACSSPPPPSGGAPKKHPTTHCPQLAYAYALGSKNARRKHLRKFLNFNLK